MRVLVCGGREYKGYHELAIVLDGLHAERHFTLLVHGDARGADKMAGKWAKLRGIQQVKVPANWEGEGGGAGPKRNKLMLELINPQLCVAFPGGTGTNNMIKQSLDWGIEIIDAENLI